MEQDIKQQWLSSIIQLIKIGESNEFLEEDGTFDVCLSSDKEKISIQFKIEKTNIIQFPQIIKK